MAGTAWMSRPASEKQVAFITKMADEKVTSGLSETLLERLADLASGVEISGGEASGLIDALMAAPRKPKPSAGFAPLVSDRAEREARYKDAKAECDRLETIHEQALAAAGGKSAALGRCINCQHSDHADKKCDEQWYYSLGYDDGYMVVCGCAEFVEAGPLHEAARVAGLPLNGARHAREDAWADYRDMRRGDHVVVARGRKVPKGSKGQIIKVDAEGRYGTSVFLLLADGSKAWTALSNVDHEEV